MSSKQPMPLDVGDTYTRRLPVYFLIGVGDTMKGQPIQSVELGLRSLYAELLAQPQAVEQIWASIITFATKATQLVPLKPLTGFSFPALKCGGSYNLGQGLQTMMRALQHEITPTLANKKGDYRSLVFLVFDNNPTDRWEKELAALEKARAEKRLGSLIAIGLGERANLAVLRQITDSVLWMAELKPGSMNSFFNWTSASVSTVSRRISLFPSDVVTPLPKPPPECSIIV